MSIRQSLSLLSAELGVPLSDLSDEALDLVALRFIAEDNITAVALGKIVDQVRHNERAEGGGSPPEEVTNAGTDKSESPVSLASPSAHPVSSRCPTCSPKFLAHTPSGGGWFHERTCSEHPNAKIVVAHKHRERDERVKQTASHQAEDVRATVIPIRRPGGSCAKCGGPAQRTYCRSCREVLDIVKGRR